MKKVFMSVICAVLLAVSYNQAIGAGKSSEAPPANQIEEAAAVIDKIDLNTADVSLLSELPGIGPKTAEAINVYRQDNGPFKSIDDITNVKGIGPAKFEKLKSLITVS